MRESTFTNAICKAESKQISKDFAYCEDTISRQAAIDALNTGLWGVEWDKALATAMLMDLPSVQPGQRYTNEELMIFQHGISLSLLSKRSAQHWRYDENTATEIEFLERLYEKVSANMRGGQNE